MREIPLVVGSVLAGQFRLDAVVGEGGFGVVFRARDLILDRDVAVKTLAGTDIDERLDARFHREARSQARLRHPATVRLLHFGYEGETAFMVQEFVVGQTLKGVVGAEGPLTSERAIGVFCSLLDALDEAHAHGIVHRDLKPSNIMLVQGLRGEEARLLDFGIAKLAATVDTEIDLTATGMLIGTPTWMAPDQALRQPVTPAYDIYSIGCVLYYALCGRPPFVGSHMQVMMDHVRRQPPPLPPTVPASVAAVTMRAMAKHPTERYPSAAAMAGALSVALNEAREAGKPSVSPVSSAARAPQPGDTTPMSISDLVRPAEYRWGHTWPRLLAGAVGLAMLAFLGAWWQTTDTPTPRATAAVNRGDSAPAPPEAVSDDMMTPSEDAASGDEAPSREDTRALDGGQPIIDAGAADAAADGNADDTGPTDDIESDPRAAEESRKSRTSKQTRKKHPAPGPKRKASKPSGSRAQRTKRIAALDKAMKGTLAACDCDRAWRAVELLRSRYQVDRLHRWREACAHVPGASCAVSLNAKLTKRMEQCPCHDAKALVDRLATFGIDRSRAWYQRCVPSGLPGSCGFED